MFLEGWFDMDGLELLARALDVSALVIPVVCVLRWEYRGVWLGGALAWLALLAEAMIVASLVPNGDANIGVPVVLLLGLPPRLTYAALVYGVTRAIRAL